MSQTLPHAPHAEVDVVDVSHPSVSAPLVSQSCQSSAQPL
jgi:hypothetical protein